MLQPMLDKDIKVDAFAVKTKVQDIKVKPRTVSFQVGGDDEERISTTPPISPPPNTLKFGQFCVVMPPEDLVKPNFRTPPSAEAACQKSTE